MAKLTPAALKRHMGNVFTAAGFRESNVALVPVLPDGSLADLALVAFIDAGQPPGDGFFAYNGDDYKLVEPEAWERGRHAKAGPAKFDPINGEVLSPDGLAAYTALAPIKVLGGGTVPAIELIAYGAEMKLLPPDLTSREARRFFTSGTDAVQPPEDLKAAARAWPYDPKAAGLAQRRLSEGVAPKIPPRQPPVEPERRQRNGGGPTTLMSDVLLARFSPAELAIAMRGNEELGDRGVLTALPDPYRSSPLAWHHAVVEAVRNRGLESVFKAVLRAARPFCTAEIDAAVMR